MPALEAYLQRMRTIHATGRATNETSYYTPLENLLSDIGANLNPSVVVTSQLSTRGAGIAPRGTARRSLPDFGFFVQETQDLRGLIEAKGASESVYEIARQPQVARYLRIIPAVLITTYREFLFVTRGSDGSVQLGEFYSLADNENSFWNAPIRDLVAAHENGLRAFLENILRFSGPIVSAEELALVLSRYAAEARSRIVRQNNRLLDPLREAMSNALGVSFLGPNGETFFRSSLIQTLFYGLFSSWIIWHEKGHGNEQFEWESASSYLNLSVIGGLFEAIATNRRLRELNLSDPMRWAEEALNRVDEDAFFATFDQQYAIQYFYEPFLEAYDPELREQLGVWYTPIEIVRYQIQRIDQLLREELQIAKGIADESVVILDPCTGTGSYLLEAARLIHQRLMEEEESLAAARTKQAIATRLLGFEILPAPFVIAHLQMGRLASGFGSGFGEGERAGIYLSNALTNWVGEAQPEQSPIPELLEEREAAERIKREERILVIVGNPPYYRYTSLAVGEEANLIAPYKEGLYRRFKTRKSTIEDLYIRFFRLGEWRIAEQFARRGIVSYISNWSWLAGSSFPVMRERLIQNFDRIYIDSLGGGYRGRDRRIDEADQSVFATSISPGIGISVAISFLVTRGGQKPQDHQAESYYRRLFGSADTKRAALLESLRDNNTAQPYQPLPTSVEKKWVLRPAGEAGTYDTWFSVDMLLPARESGVNENRGGSLISIDRQPLEQLMAVYTNIQVNDRDVTQSSERAGQLMRGWARYDSAKVRAALNDPQQPDKPRLVRYAFKPFDDRWLMWGGAKLLNEKRKDLLDLVDGANVPQQERNIFIVMCENARVAYSLPGLTIYLGDLHYLDPWAQFFPLRDRKRAVGFMPAIVRPNLDAKMLAALARIRGVATTATDANANQDEMQIGEEIFYHIVATLYTPVYRSQYEDALTTNWARIPIPVDSQLLSESVRLGRRIAELLRTDLPDDQVLRDMPDEIRRIARPKSAIGEQLRDPDDLGVTINYRGVGRVEERKSTAEELGRADDVEGQEVITNDVYWNATAYWANVPLEVWEFQIGNFPVLRKWLEARLQVKLGRPMSLAEVMQFSSIARRIATILQLGDELDNCHEIIAESELITQAHLEE